MPIWVIAILVFLAVLFFLALCLAWKKFHRKGFSDEQSVYIKAHWIRIIDAFSSHPGQSVLDADKLLDYALKCYGYEGSLGEKLKKAGGRFSDLNGVWSAHKLRNTLAHELVNVNNGHGKQALVGFKKALNDLGANL
ncbi:hypothetical protein HZA40_00355 [Candidatus Peregrinibacteria bacterium]|nr:hypothetical protein [Candidatus Peregrinibacteria bacterium]